MQISGSRGCLDRPEHVIDGNSAGSYTRIDFRVVRNLDLIVDGNVLEPGAVLAHADLVFVLFERGIGDNFLDAFFRVAEKRPATGDLAEDVNFAVAAATDFDVARAIAQFHSHRSR